MTYQDHVKEVFVNHQNAMGMDIEEAEEMFQEANFAKVEKWLGKQGYDLSEFIFSN
jgi:hypothetical protein